MVHFIKPEENPKIGYWGVWCGMPQGRRAVQSRSSTSHTPLGGGAKRTRGLENSND